MAKWIAKSSAEVAQFFGVSAKTVAQWRQDGMPGESRKYDLARVYLWKNERDKKREQLYADRRKKSIAADPDRAWKAARAELMNLRVEQARGQLMLVEKHDDFIVRLCSTFRNGLFSLAATLNAQLEGLDEPTRLEVIEEHFKDLLAAFSNGDGDPGASPRAEAQVPGGAEAAEEGNP